MARRFLEAALGGLVVYALGAGCGDGDKADDTDHPEDSDSGDDSGDDTGDPPDGDRAHPLCDEIGPDPFPDDMGESCPMGSNLDLCVNLGSDACESNLCLWDAADPVGDRAYCTVRCELGDASSCPDGYTCTEDLCEEVPICQRTEIPTEAEGGYEVEIPRFFNSNYVLWWVARDGEGTNTWVNSIGEVYQVTAAADGLEPGTAIPASGASGLTVGTDVILFIDGNDEYLYKLSGGELSRVELDDGLRMTGGFRAPDGTLYYSATDSFEDYVTVLFSFDPATLQPTSKPIPFEDGLMPGAATPLVEDGFVALCEKGKEEVICVGTGPDDVVELPLPSFAKEASWQAVREMRHSYRTDALWWANEDGLALWNGEEWIEEDELMPFRRPSGVVPFEDGRAILFIEAPGDAYEALYLDGECWHALHPGGVGKETLSYNAGWNTSMAELRPDVLGYSSDDGDLLSIAVSSFP